MRKRGGRILPGQRPTSGQAGNLIEQQQIRAIIHQPVFRRIGQHPAGRLRHRQAGLTIQLAPSHPDEIGPFLAGLEHALVTPRRDLKQLDRLRRESRADHPRIQQQAVQEVARLCAGIHHQHSLLAALLHPRFQAGVQPFRDRPAHHLAEKAGVIRPVHPVLRPAGCSVCRPGYRPPQPELPCRQNRISVRFRAAHQHLRGFLGGAGNIAIQRRHALDTAHDRVLPDQGREELLLHNIGTGRQHRFGGENRGDRGHVPRQVEVTLSGGGHILQERREAIPNCNHGSRGVSADPHLLHGFHDAAGIGPAIRQQNHMAHDGGIIRDIVRRRAHPGQNIRPATGPQRRHLRLDRARVFCRCGVHDPARAAVEADHADPVNGVKQVHRANDRFFGQVQVTEAAGPGGTHRTGCVDHKQKRQRREPFLILDLHLHRQGVFERGAVVAAHAVAVITANRHQPAAEVAHVGTQHLHAQRRQIRRRDIHQNQAGIGAQRSQSDGQVARRDHIQRQADFLQRGPQILNGSLPLRPGACHQQHPRRPGDLGES